MHAITIIAIMIIIVCILTYLFKFGISHILDYYPNSDGITFIIFRSIKIYTLEYANIEACRAYKLLDFSWLDGKLSTAFRVLTVGGWPRLTRAIVKLKRGPFTCIVLFPRDPTSFADDVQQHLVDEI